MVAYLCILTVCALMQQLASAGTFLAPSLESVAQRVDPGLLHKLVAEVQDALGGSLRVGSKQALAEMEEMLRPTFKSMPKNEHGRLGHAAVRYVLHRLFVQRRGWVIRGFQHEPSNEAWNSSLASQMLHAKMPGLVQEIFESRIGEEGSSLHDIAVLAALFEHLIDDDMKAQLQSVYMLNGVPVENPADAALADRIISLYMMFFIQGHTDVEDFDQEQVQEFMDNFAGIYPAWMETYDMLERVKADIKTGLTSFTFDDISAILAEATHRYYNLVHHAQCQVTKDMLLEIEDKAGSGRVKLLDFYRAALYDNKYQFTETIDYLRQIGTLDESVASTPRLIIPNYVSGQSNCVARTSYYAVCCPDDCESRMDQLEHVLSKPEATPREILAVVDSGEPLAKLDVRRLNDIASHHDGKVPLHGRLFTQWMHFVFPQSCVYPHLSGAAYTKTMEEWEEETGLFSGSTMDELSTWEKQLHEQSLASEGQDHSADMWTMEEELIVARPSLPVVEAGTGSSTFCAKAVLFLFVAVAALAWLQFSSNAKGSRACQKSEKYQV